MSSIHATRSIYHSQKRTCSTTIPKSLDNNTLFFLEKVRIPDAYDKPQFYINRKGVIKITTKPSSQIAQKSQKIIAFILKRNFNIATINRLFDVLICTFEFMYDNKVLYKNDKLYQHFMKTLKCKDILNAQNNVDRHASSDLEELLRGTSLARAIARPFFEGNQADRKRILDIWNQKLSYDETIRKVQIIPHSKRY